MIEQWTTTRDTRVAAALGTLGVPTRIKRTLIERKGEQTTRFYLALRGIDERVRCTQTLLAQWKRGALESNQPAHPFLTVLRAFANRNMLLDCANKGEFVRLVRVPGTEVWQYVRGNEGLPGIAGHKEVIKTGDLKLAAALGVVGLPVLRIEGVHGSRQYFLPRYGPARTGGLPPVDGHALRGAWTADKESVPWEDPFAQAARGLHNRERFLDAVNKEVELVLLQKPRSVKSAGVRADAAPAAWDKMKKFFDS